MLSEFYTVCERRRLKVNTIKRKLEDFEGNKSKVEDFAIPYRISIVN